MENTGITRTRSLHIFQSIEMLRKLQQRYALLDHLFHHPHSIVIHGCQNLRSIPGQHWKSKIHSLFYDANLPQFWILDVINTNNEDLPNVITIQLIDIQVKLFVKATLQHFFNIQHKNNIFITEF